MVTEHPNPFQVLIIDAGTGGLCLAHGLKRAGIPVAVYERERTRRDGLDGYRVAVVPDGSRALHECLPPELFATFTATCAQAGNYFTMLTEILSMSGWAPKDPNATAVERSASRITLTERTRALLTPTMIDGVSTAESPRTCPPKPR